MFSFSEVSFFVLKNKSPFRKSWKSMPILSGILVEPLESRFCNSGIHSLSGNRTRNILWKSAIILFGIAANTHFLMEIKEPHLSRHDNLIRNKAGNINATDDRTGLPFASSCARNRSTLRESGRTG